MPVSVVFEFYLVLRNWFIFKAKSAPYLHKKKVEKIQHAVRLWNEDGKKTKMCTGRPGWMTMSLRVGKYKERSTRIKLELYDILNIDVIKETVLLEPQVTMGQLTAALVPLGWTIPVLPELDDLTVGGLIMGCGIETSSHKYGLFQHTCISYDIILANGDLIHCAKDQNSDLFYAIPWSHGSLGFIVAAELKIMPAKKYVRINYQPIIDLDDMVVKFQESAANIEENDFVECLAYSKDESVLMTGQLVDDVEPQKINCIGRFWKPWFYQHVQGFLSARKCGTEYIPLREYYHRHTRSLFWEMQDILPFGNHPVFRYLFGWTMPPKISLLKLTSPQVILDLYEKRHVVQDMVVPFSCLKKSLEFFHKQTELYPLWLCPARLENVPGLVHPFGNKPELYVDIGAYGNPKSDAFMGPATVAKIESFVIEHHGFQLLYADSYLTRDNFQKMFDHTLHKQLRKKYDCEDAFDEIYDKVSRAARR